MMGLSRFAIMGGLGTLFLFGCGPVPPPEVSDHKVVVVLPPENMTAHNEVEERSYPEISAAFAQRGYYCISPELVRAVFNANKFEDAGRINTLPVQKIGEVFGADAVLRTRVTEWSTTYILVYASVTVGLEMELLDVKTGGVIWTAKRTLSKKPDPNQVNDPISLLVASAFTAMLSYDEVVDENAHEMLSNLIQGPYYGQW